MSVGSMSQPDLRKDITEEDTQPIIPEPFLRALYPFLGNASTMF